MMTLEISSYRSLLLAVILLAIGYTNAQEKTEADKLVTIHKGNLPIILSAPHGGRTPLPDSPDREGKGVPRFVTVTDDNTDELALKIADFIERELDGKVYVVVARFQRAYVDVNRAKGDAFESLEAEPYYDAYHDALDSACKQIKREWGYGVLIDIHGQSLERTTIFRGTGDGRTVSKMVERFGREAFTGPQSICGQLEQRGFSLEPSGDSDGQEHPHFNGGHIVQTYGSNQETGIDALQLEFGTRLRSDDRIARAASGVASAVAAFARSYLPKHRLETNSSSANQ